MQPIFMYATAHNKQFLVNNIFMPSISFYKYHKNKKLMVLFALLPTHTYPHNAFKSTAMECVMYADVHLDLYCFKTELRTPKLSS